MFHVKNSHKSLDFKESVTKYQFEAFLGIFKEEIRIKGQLVKRNRTFIVRMKKNIVRYFIEFGIKKQIHITK